MLGSLNLSAIITQIANSGELLLLTTKSRQEWRATHGMFHSQLGAVSKEQLSATASLNQERGLKFSPGFQASVENEMIWNFIFLLHLAEHEKGGEVQKVRLWTGAADVMRHARRRDVQAGLIRSSCRFCPCSRRATRACTST